MNEKLSIHAEQGYKWKFSITQVSTEKGQRMRKIDFQAKNISISQLSDDMYYFHGKGQYEKLHSSEKS